MNFEDESIIREGVALIVDECHNCLNEDSKFFSKLLMHSNFPIKLLLSASINDEQKEYLERNGVHFNYQVSLFWCKKNELTPSYEIINIPVDLSQQEKHQIVRIEAAINAISYKFAALDIINPFEEELMDSNYLNSISAAIGMKVNEIRKMVINWRGLIQKRKSIYQNATNKIGVVKHIVEKIGFDKKILIFCTNIKESGEVLNREIPRSILYAGVSTKKKNLAIIKAFESNMFPRLISVRKLIEGYDVKDCQFAIRHSYNSNEKDAIQTIGRILRLDEENPDKKSVMFYLYVNDFTYEGTQFFSQEKKWLIKSLSNMSNVSWINVNDIF